MKNPNSFALISLFSCLAIQTLSSRLLTADYVSKSGHAILHNDNHGIYVDVDFSYNYNHASDTDDSDLSIARMALGLYTSQTVLGSSCLTFTDYNCSSKQCIPYTNHTATPTYLNFNVSDGYYASANIYLDYENWQLSNFAVIATSCACSSYSSLGYQRYGLLGLGINTSYPNFMNSSPMFSIYLAQDGLSGSLIFGSNNEIKSSSDYIGTLPATSEWKVPLSSLKISIPGDNNGISANASVLFDINSVGIGLPSALYNNLLHYLAQEFDVFCTNSTSYPTCSHNGKLGTLPTITITIGDVDIDLPPSLYAKTTGGSNQVTLNFRSLDPSFIGDNYVTPDYQNYIVFDQTFMSYYYIEFSYNDGSPTISLYNPYSTKVIWPYILGGVLGLVLIVGIICFWRRRKVRLQQEQRGSQLTLDTSNEHSLLVPPLQDE